MKIDPIKDAELLAASTEINLKEAEQRFNHALTGYKIAIKAHAEAEITLMYVKLQKGGAN